MRCLKAILVYLALCFLLFLMGAFYSVSLDPVTWDESSRSFLVFGWVMAILCLPAAYELIK